MLATRMIDLDGTSQANGHALAPPHSIEAEQSVLGAILLSDRTLYALVIEEGLRAEPAVGPPLGPGRHGRRLVPGGGHGTRAAHVPGRSYC